MNPELERKVNAYAHDYRDMCMNEEELATMLKVALLEAYELGRKAGHKEALDAVDRQTESEMDFHINRTAVEKRLGY
jgi:hypothetical protein